MTETLITTPEPTTWAQDNFAKTYLGDIRRTERLVDLAASMANQPGSSLAKLGKDWYDTKANYNLLKHKSMNPDYIQGYHRSLVADRIGEAEHDVLLVEDGSEMSWSGKEPIEGLGPVGSGRKHDQGFLLQSVLAVEIVPAEAADLETNNSARLPVKILGLADQQYYVRPPKREKTQRRRDTKEPIETDLWRNSVERLLPFSKEGKRVIRVCDRAADIYEVIGETEDAELSYVIRGRHNRTIEGIADDDGNPIRLFDHPALDRPQTNRDAYLRGRSGKESRIINLNVSSVEVTTRAPSRPGHKPGELPSLRYTIVRVWDANRSAASSEDQIEWFLLTNLSTRSESDLIQVVDIYCTRWIIEDYHKALKSGLRAEDLQLKCADALMAAVSMMSVVALRLVDLRERLRVMPDAPAKKSGLDELELIVLSKRVNRELRTVRCVGLAIGRVGGHLNRKRDGMPGIITLWRGMSELIRLVEGARIAMELKLS